MVSDETKEEVQEEGRDRRCEELELTMGRLVRKLVHQEEKFLSPTTPRSSAML